MIKKEIEEILPKSPVEYDPMHSKLVLKWVLKLKPDADEALQIAALAHDIDRAVTGITEKDLKDHSKINEFRKEHILRSVKITAELLKKYNYDGKTIEKVKGLVEKHESGGDAESDILMSADSLAYFEYNIPGYIKRYGKEKTKKKIQFMYKRLPEKARKLVREMKFKDEVGSLVKEAINIDIFNN